MPSVLKGATNYEDFISIQSELTNKEIAVLDEDKIKQAERWDGIYGIVSSHDKMKVSGEDI